MNSDRPAAPLDTLDSDLRTTAADVEALRAAAAARVDPRNLRWDWISLARQFPHLRQSTATCEGWEEFRL
jgi:hypothetical protein